MLQKPLSRARAAEVQRISKSVIEVRGRKPFTRGTHEGILNGLAMHFGRKKRPETLHSDSFSVTEATWLREDNIFCLEAIA